MYKKSYKKSSGVHASSCKATKKCVMKIKETKKNNTRVKMLLMEEGHLAIGHVWK